MLKYTIYLTVLLTYCSSEGVLEEIQKDLDDLRSKQSAFSIPANVSSPSKFMMRNSCLCLRRFLNNTKSMLNEITPQNDVSDILKKLISNIDLLLKSVPKSPRNCISTLPLKGKRSLSQHIFNSTIKYIQNWNEQCNL